jgi:hypothetical protein
VANQYTITATAGENGKIGPSGSVTVNEGDNSVFFMIPNSGYAVDQIMVDDEPVDANLIYMFENVTSGHAIHVTFKEVPEPPVIHVITVTSNDGGEVAPFGKISVYEGTSLTFKMTPKDGYYLSDFKVNGTSMDIEPDDEGVGTYTLSNITANYAIAVVFEEEDRGGSDDNCFISAVAGSAGSGSGLMLMLMTLVGGIAGIFFRKNS